MITATREERTQAIAKMDNKLLVLSYGITFEILANGRAGDNRAEFLFNQETIMQEILKRMG